MQHGGQGGQQQRAEATAEEPTVEDARPQVDAMDEVFGTDRTSEALTAESGKLVF